MTERLAHSVSDAAAILGIGRSKFYQLINTDEIAYFKIGSRTLVPHDELTAFLARQRQAA